MTRCKVQDTAVVLGRFDASGIIVALYKHSETPPQNVGVIHPPAETDK